MRALAEQLVDALSDLKRLYELRDRDQVCCHGISGTQAHAMNALAAHASGVNGVAAALNLDGSTASRVVDSLVRMGYVSREADRSDRRAVTLRMTPAGRRLHRRLRDERLAEATFLLERISPELREEMVTLLVGMVAHVSGRGSPRSRTTRAVRRQGERER